MTKEQEQEEGIQNEYLARINLGISDINIHLKYAELSEPGHINPFEAQSRIDLLKEIQADISTTSRALRLRELEPRFRLTVDKVLNDYYLAYCKAVALYNSFVNPSHPPPHERDMSFMFEASQAAQARPRYKFPEFKMLAFNGTQDEWVAWKEMFVAAVDKNEDIPRSIKYHYLRSLVKFPAGQKNILDNFASSEDCYEAAFTALCKRFDDPKRKKAHLFNRLLSVKSMSGESAAEVTRMIDEFSSLVTSLNLCEVTLDDMFVHVVQFRLDDTTSREWQKHIKDDQEPTFAKMMEFLSDYLVIISSLSSGQKKSTSAKPKTSQDLKPGTSKSFATVPSSGCTMCREPHLLYSCPKFRALTVDERFKFVNDSRLCRNCLSPGHQQRNCRSTNRCRFCKKQHNSLLHNEKIMVNSSEVAAAPSSGQAQAASSPAPSPIVAPFRPLTPPNITYQPRSHVSISQCSANRNQEGQSYEALLTTAVIYVLDVNNKWKTGRVLLDSGSQGNHITTSFAKDLGIPLKPSSEKIFGISGQTSHAKFNAEVIVASRYRPFTATLGCLVSDEITGSLPPRHIDPSCLEIPSDVFLADSLYFMPARIDMLVGTGMFHDIQLNNVIRRKDAPTLMETCLGWTVGGYFPVASPSTSAVASNLLCCYTQQPNSGIESLDEKLEKFMELESCGIANRRPLSREQQYCINVYDATTSFDPVAKEITVRLPEKEGIDQLESNIGNAVRQFFYQESRRLANQKFNEAYVDYIENLISSGRMSEVSPSLQNEGYYMPHHGVEKTLSSTTKVRPVFNGSSISKSKKSLNQCLCVGPVVQPELFDVLLRFRQGAYVLKSDVERMYLQVKVDESQRKFQKILWRKSKEEPLKHYTINCVTFGLAPSSFLATYSLVFAARRFAEQFPEASKVIMSCFYVDDFVFTFDDLKKGLEIRDQIRYILLQISFPMRKWSSNCPQLLENLPSCDLESVENGKSLLKTLGITYDSRTDLISFPIKTLGECPRTKAEMLSEIASLFDPIGWIGPVVVYAKMLMKKTRNLKWNDELSDEIRDSWQHFREKLPSLSELMIPRNAFIIKPVSMTIHGFSDASLDAYGCCFYARSIDDAGNIHVSLLCSKSRVTPPKQQTIARLELCAATLMSKLLIKIKEALNFSIENVTLWIDSIVALFWIAAEPSTLSVFCGNRVAVCQENSDGCRWRHCISSDMPADVLSRGLPPDEIADCRIWWNGPEFLKNPEPQWPETMLEINAKEKEMHKSEMKRVFVSSRPDPLMRIIETRFSSMQKVINTFTYLRRIAFAEDYRLPLTLEEMELATLFIVRYLQKHFFAAEFKYFLRKMKDPKSPEKFPSKSSLHQLTPFMNEKGVICVGGRIAASPELTIQQKHPMILPRCHFSKLIIRYLHQKFLHPGNAAMLSFVRENYWILGAKSTIRAVKKECLICFRAEPKFPTQIMSDLPRARVEMSSPFLATAVDYAGPFDLRTSLTKKSSIKKVYVAVFKCMSTGAIHLEPVTSLSTPAFIDTFDRFVSRRGMSVDLFSDNGSNLRGANNEFQRILFEIESEIGEELKEKKIRWHFSTPLAPHTGGYYESGVKTMKHHLVRECANRSFDFEQLTTLLCKIEAIVNSRPLMPLSDDPNDFAVLTPAHFLIGRSMIAKPERNFIPVNTGRLDRYNQLQQLQQKIWAVWYHDYLHHLQTRPLNFREVNEFRIGDMVLLKEPHLHPMKWIMGRVIELYPDKKGDVRTVLVKTPFKNQNGEFATKKRHIKYLAFLPREEEVVARPESVRINEK
jgi:hypothetical protein